MLTDIFCDRYLNVELRSAFEERDRKLLVQCFRILSEQICPYWIEGKESQRGKDFWNEIHSRLAMELGLKSLSQTYYSYEQNINGVKSTRSGFYTMDIVCENWMLSPCAEQIHADRFIKERLSLVELGFRKRESEISVLNARLPIEIKEAQRRELRQTLGGIHLPGDPVAGVRALNSRVNSDFQLHVDELNTRFRQAGYDLNYHNGMVQRVSDSLIEKQVDRPFWEMVAGPEWKNVDTDIKEALDKRDTGGRDPAFYAARALESSIKIISDENGWTHGKEGGAYNYIENLASKNHAFIEPWEAELLKAYFSKIRNPLGHGPGSEAMPALTSHQTDWAIEASMSWIKSLIGRRNSR